MADSSKDPLSRRRLVQLGAAGGALLALGPAARAAGPDGGPDGGAASTGATASDAGAAATPAVDVQEATLEALQTRMARGELTARALTDAYLDRIAALDGRLRSVLETNPDARAQADALDAERRAGKVRGPLHGIPVLLKDNIATRDRMHTTAGSVTLLESTVPADAPLVARLREAGAVLLGKTQLSEWANFRSRPSSSGWSGRGGQCRNAYALDRSPSGSSSGSGVAVSASLCAVAVGTETDGSVVSPAAASGLVGVKPTVGLVSGAGIVPISHVQDTAGPMARTVREATLLLATLSQRAPDEPRPRGAGPAWRVDDLSFLREDALKGARIGVARAVFFGYHPPTDRVAEEALRALRSAGAVLVDPADLPTAAKLGEPENEALLHEFKHDLEAYLQGLGGRGPRTLEELIEAHRAHADVELRGFGLELFEQAAKKGPLTDAAYRRARDTCTRLSRREGIDAVMDRHRLDALVAPTQGPAWLIDPVNGDSDAGGCSSPAAVSGYPHVTVPMGQVRGLPVGLSFFGRAWSEKRLLALAYAFEQTTHARRAPGFAASAAPA